jgi:hypothetical protein
VVNTTLNTPVRAEKEGTMETKCTWESRELGRFADGTYKTVPVSLAYPAKHYVHLSVTDTENDYVAYTPSDAYGEADRQVRLKFGRYLHKTFPELTDAEIQSHVTELKSALSIADKPAVLRFATDIQTINRIFETEMRACDSSYTSCMYGKFADDSIRPYHVYAGSPDVAVAYVTDGEGAIVSRSVVSTKDKVWVRCYSVVGGESCADCCTLRSLLADAGYAEGKLDGNRLTKLSTRRVMLPYIDSGGRDVRDDGDYWVVVADGDGDYKADSTDGTVTECGNRCECCGCREEDCECYICQCCGERSPDGCDECCMCEECGGCTTHDRCSCARCSECLEVINPRHRHTTSCECDRCDECHELTSECECETEDETEAEVPEAEPELPVTSEQVIAKLTRIWKYLLDTYGEDATQAEYELLSRIARAIWEEGRVTA